MREIYNFMVSLYGSSSKDDLEMDETSIGLLKKDDKYDKNEKKSITREFKQQKWQYYSHSLRPDSLDENGHYISQGRAEIPPGDGVNRLQLLPNTVYKIVQSFSHPDDNVQLQATSTANFGKDPQLVLFRHARERAYEAAELCVPVCADRDSICCLDIEICLPEEYKSGSNGMESAIYRNIRIDLANPRDVCREAETQILSQDERDFSEISCSLMKTIFCLPILCTFCSPCIGLQFCLRCCGAFLGSVEDCKSIVKARPIKNQRNKNRIKNESPTNIFISTFKERKPWEPSAQVMSDDSILITSSASMHNQSSWLRSYMQYPGMENMHIQNYEAKKYEFGSGGHPKDLRKAIYWYKRAATNGHVDAQILMGLWCEGGKNGLIRDPLKAIYWYQLAAIQGNKNAQKELRRLKLSRGSDISSSSRLLSSFRGYSRLPTTNLKKTIGGLGVK